MPAQLEMVDSIGRGLDMTSLHFRPKENIVMALTKDGRYVRWRIDKAQKISVESHKELRVRKRKAETKAETKIGELELSTTIPMAWNKDGSMVATLETVSGSLGGLQESKVVHLWQETTGFN